MNLSSGNLILLIITWTTFLIAGMSFIWKAIMDKSSPTKSKSRRILNEIKFRLGFAAGMVFIVLFLSGVFWLLVKK